MTRNAKTIVGAAMAALAGFSAFVTGCAGGDDEAAVTKKDTGVVAADTGTGPVDTGTAPVDTGTPPTDTGTPPTDTGTPPTDTGGSCTVAMIDDMELGLSGIGKACGRLGFWYTYNDGTTGATQTPSAGTSFLPETIPGGRGTSTKAAHTSGSGFTTWGAGMAFDLNNAGGTATKGTYSAAGFSGITFYAKASASLPLRVNVSTSSTDPVGGICSGAKCNDHFGSSITLSTAWTAYTLTFKDIKQQGWGTPATFDATKLVGLQFQVDKGTTFDFWVDDVAFVP